MIEVGEYVRTPYHKIEKIEKIKQEDGWICVTTDKNAYELEWLKTNKVKHSKNIIDLIEVEDYVNGYKIIAINYKENYITIQNINEFDENGIKVLQEDEIKTILTKEQMEANCYTVERKEEC